jgi:hypothetical protein
MATRALVGYLENGVLTSTYNHYDGYPENLGKALNQFYSTSEKAKEIANRGYISYVDPETGEIEAANQDTPDKLDLNKMDPNQAIEEVAGLIDSYGADYAYFFTPNASTWDYIKNKGIRSMIDSLEGILFDDFDNTYDEEEMNEEIKDVKGHAMMLLDKVESQIKPEEKDMFKTYQESVMRDIKSGGSRLNQYEEFSVEDMMEDYRNYISDKMDIDESIIHQWKFRAGIIK